MYCAVWGGHMGLVRLLLGHRAGVQCVQFRNNNYGQTPLHVAIPALLGSAGRVSANDAFTYRANTGARDKYGHMTPVHRTWHCTAWRGHTGVMWRHRHKFPSPSVNECVCPPRHVNKNHGSGRFCVSSLNIIIMYCHGYELEDESRLKSSLGSCATRMPVPRAFL
ncbi:hypothetical protein H4582DRAFT_1529962 [Lactarius indigo]|nr:hypothetical protein H4582DRAFT_1529962 [Lactarius indigo]